MSLLISFICVSSLSWGLPECPKSGYKHNCFGTKISQNGDKYVGEFKNGLPNGNGTKIWKNGDKYIGEWKNDQRNGNGTYTWKNGDKYIGGWKDNKRDGQGTGTFISGKVLEGIWKEDKFIYAQKFQKTERKFVEVSRPKTSSKELDLLKLQA